MRKEAEPTVLGKQYADAHEAHHGEKDLRGAFELYTAIIAAYPSSLEAAYARSQVQNILNTVVPKQDIFEAQVALLSACFARTRAADGADAEGTP